MAEKCPIREKGCNAMKKKSMSVPEMARILGIKKTDSYWLIKKHFFTVITVAGHMRVMIDSFEEWYANQVHYKKVDGTPPGKNLDKTSMSIQQTADLLGVSQYTVYEILKRNGNIKTFKVGMYLRIDKASFEEWYRSQSRYKKVNRNEEIKK